MLYEPTTRGRWPITAAWERALHLLAVFMVFITFSSVGLPGLNGFLGELLVLAGMYDFSGTEVRATCWPAWGQPA